MSERLFAYGANMAAEEMAAFCPEARFAGLARLPDHRLELRRRSRRWRGGAADVVAAPGAEVWGVLYELPDACLSALDAKEGEGFAYRRRPAEVEGEGGERVSAWLYEVVEREPEEVPPAPAYRDRLLAGARERGLPSSYLDELAGRMYRCNKRPEQE